MLNVEDVSRVDDVVRRLDAQLQWLTCR